jgi:hypothetical protein
MEHIRFVKYAPPELQGGNPSPIDGYQQSPVLPLEQAIAKLVPLVGGIMNDASEAKAHCNQSTMFTQDESAAVYLYSMPIPLISRLVEDVRAGTRQALEPWFPFLKLFMNAVEKLPPIECTVWRGIDADGSSMFVNNDVHTWWGVTSCSMSRNIVEPFLGQKSTLFAIDATHAKDISALSVFPEENEVILMPGTRVQAKSPSHTAGDRYSIIHLKEVHN